MAVPPPPKNAAGRQVENSRNLPAARCPEKLPDKSHVEIGKLGFDGCGGGVD